MKGFSPLPHQQDVLDLLTKRERLGRIVTVKSSRQKGKSLLIINLLLFYAFNYKRTSNFCVAPTLKQSKNLFKMIVNACPNEIVSSSNATDLDIEFINRSTISFRSAEQGDSLRGYTCKGILCVDECAFIPDDVFYKILPWVDVWKSPILLVSSPYVKSGFFWHYYSLGLQGDNPKMFSINWSDPKYKESMEKLLPSERLEEYRKILPSNQFKSEYLGEFLDDAGSVFTGFRECIKNLSITNNDSLYVGIDWAVGNSGDDTVLIALNQDGCEVEQMILNNISPTDQINRIATFLRKYKSKIKVITPETNSIGNVYIDQLFTDNPDLKSIRCEPFTTTNDSKNKIVTQLQNAFEQRKISILGTEKELNELGTYAMEFNPHTKKITYNAPNGLHDDICMALALAYNGLLNQSKTGYYAVTAFGHRYI